MGLDLASKPEECPSYEECRAPLCPLGEGSKDVTWIPGEQICICKVFRSLPWIRMQRRLERKGKKGFFNIEMLVLMKRVTDGIDPNTKRTPEAWIKRRERGRP